MPTQPDQTNPPRPKKARPSKNKRINPRRLTHWQGQKNITHTNQISFQWNTDLKRYFPVAQNPEAPNPKHRRVVGIYYTYFSAVGAYPIMPTGVGWFYSNDLFGRAVFRSNDTRMRQGIRPSDHDGLVPFQKFMDEINEYVGVTDWTKAYKEVEYRFEQGASVYIIDSRGVKTLRKFPIPNTLRTERTYSDKRAKEIDKRRKEYRRKKSEPKKPFRRTRRMRD